MEESRRAEVVWLWHLGLSLAAIGRSLCISAQMVSRIAIAEGLRRRATPKKPDSAPDCLCGTGSYCHRHRQYRLPPPPKNKDGTPKKEYALRMMEESGMVTDQQCGGGKRIHRKRIGGI